VSGAQVQGQKARAKSQDIKAGGSCCGPGGPRSGTCIGKEGVNPGVTAGLKAEHNAAVTLAVNQGLSAGLGAR
jgi:hypothetical protein